MNELNETTPCEATIEPSSTQALAPGREVSDLGMKWYDFKRKVRYLPGIRRICDAWYYSKCAVWNKYNRVHVKTLDPTWHDRCTLLPHVMFQVLEDFVKKECSPGCVNWESDEQHSQARKKMDELLDWWHNVYLKFDAQEGFDESKATPPNERFSPCPDREGYSVMNSNEYEDEFYREANRKESEMQAELFRKMKELVDLTPWLWT